MSTATVAGCFRYIEVRRQVEDEGNTRGLGPTQCQLSQALPDDTSG